MPNILKKIAGAVGKAAPLLARTILGPAGGAAVDIVKDVLGIPDASDEELASKVESLTADELLAIQEAERKHYRLLAELEVQDKASARDLAKTHGLLHHSIITYTFLAGWFGIEIAARAGALAPGNEGWTEVMIFAFSTILTFWFGSSFGSKMKDATDRLRQRGV